VRKQLRNRQKKLHWKIELILTMLLTINFVGWENAGKMWILFIPKSFYLDLCNSKLQLSSWLSIPSFFLETFYEHSWSNGQPSLLCLPITPYYPLFACTPPFTMSNNVGISFWTGEFTRFNIFVQVRQFLNESVRFSCNLCSRNTIKNKLLSGLYPFQTRTVNLQHPPPATTIWLYIGVHDT
jgi:hypothetical protein